MDGGGGLPESNPDIFLVLNFNILHFYSYREEVPDPCMPP